MPRVIAYVLILGGVLAIATVGLTSEMLRPVIWGIPATMIVAGATLTEDRLWTSWPATSLRLLGDASYSLYLVHVPVIEIFRYYGWRTTNIFLVIITVAIVTHFTVEKPILDLYRWRKLV